MQNLLIQQKQRISILYKIINTLNSTEHIHTLQKHITFFFCFDIEKILKNQFILHYICTSKRICRFVFQLGIIIKLLFQYKILCIMYSFYFGYPFIYIYIYIYYNTLLIFYLCFLPLLFFQSVDYKKNKIQIRRI